MTTIAYPESLELSAPATVLLTALDERVNEVAESVYKSQVWMEVTSAASSHDHVLAILREIMLSVYWYQSKTTEAGFLMLGRLPKDSGKVLTTLLAHKADEAEHGLWALRDYLEIGGTREIANGPPSPATASVAAMWWYMAVNEDPLGYVGAEYLFEYLTARILPDLLQALTAHRVSITNLGFIRDHAHEDIAHTQLLRSIASRIVDRYPGAERAIFRCFDYFRQVYPLPVWLEALKRAKT